MEAIIAAIIAYMLDQGPLGLVTLALGWGYWNKDRQLEALNREIRTLLAEYAGRRKNGRAE